MKAVDILTKLNDRVAMLYGSSDINQWRVASKRLLNAAVKDDDKRKEAFALLNLGAICFHENEMEDGTRFVSRSLDIAHSAPFHDYEAFAYNLLGTVFQKNNHELRALEYYLKALDSIKDTDQYIAMGGLFNNIAALYFSFGDYESVLNYYETVRSYYRMEREKRNLNQIMPVEIVELVNRGFTYCAIKEYQNAKHCIDELREVDDALMTKAYCQSLYVLEARYYLGISDEDNFQEAVDRVIMHAPDTGKDVDCFREYIALMMALLERNEYNTAGQMLQILSDIAVEQDNEELLLDSISAKIRYCEVLQEVDALENLYEQYYQLSGKASRVIRDTKIAGIRMKSSLKDIVDEQEKVISESNQWKVKSEHDPLTGLANRYLMNAEGELKLKDAANHGIAFGVILIDIDYFKQYNDQFGHLMGDTCLQSVADTIRDACNGQHLCARYGGDEYLIITVGCDQEEMKFLCERIRTGMLVKSIRHADSAPIDTVTLSQGICCRIPTHKDKLSFFIKKADEALYEGKENGRGKIYVAN